jgi:hypothetical protein
MTHTLHRQGSEEALSNEYIFLCMAAKNINEDETTADKMREFLRIVLRHNPVNVGSMTTGNIYKTDINEILSKVASTSIVHGIFNDYKNAVEFLEEVKKANFGLSVVVSGVFKSAEKCCAKTGLKPHSIDYSAGVWGRTEKLPSKDLLEMTTMCGHGMISSNLVLSMVQGIRNGEISLEDAARELAKPCECGIFNPVRAAKLLTRMMEN